VTRGRETAEATAGPLFDVECGIVRDLDVAYRHVCVLCVLCATVGVGSMWRSIHPRPAVQSSRVRCPGDTAALPVDDKSTNNHQRSKLLHKRPSSNITPTANTNGYDLGCVQNWAAINAGKTSPTYDVLLLLTSFVVVCSFDSRKPLRKRV
jgi:hypothetical protein